MYKVLFLNLLNSKSLSETKTEALFISRFQCSAPGCPPPPPPALQEAPGEGSVVPCVRSGSYESITHMADLTFAFPDSQLLSDKVYEEQLLGAHDSANGVRTPGGIKQCLTPESDGDKPSALHHTQTTPTGYDAGYRCSWLYLNPQKKNLEGKILKC